ncbi:hypothetical protein DSUL_100004 [Desulfovibrionales bacterium]
MPNNTSYRFLEFEVWSCHQLLYEVLFKSHLADKFYNISEFVVCHY